MLGPMLGKLYDDKSLDKIQFAINNTVNKASGETLNRLLFGVSQRDYIHDALKEYVMKK